VRMGLTTANRSGRVCEMAEGPILEFEGVGREQYEAINGRLGIDMESGQGDWPAR
jgi:hypothetical protein